MLHPEGDDKPELDRSLDRCRQNEDGYRCLVQTVESFERELEEYTNLVRRVKELEKELKKHRRSRPCR